MVRKDSDLIELGGYWVYEIMENGVEKPPLTVNGRVYEVVDIRRNGNHGLDAITVVAELTGEVSIIYEGTTDLDDIRTDFGLITGETDAQFDEAQNYYLEMKQKLTLLNQERIKMGAEPYDSKVSNVGGNSLGGSLANYIAKLFEQDGIFAVTLDPAPLPSGVEPSNNGINYVTHTSPLHLAAKGAGYFPSRFPGRFEFVKYGIFSIEKFVANHTGYEKKSEGWGIDDFLPFS
ncbi:MAG: hypothetical protein ACRC6X_09025, partial [Culicoidibacterales bacterium]